MVDVGTLLFQRAPSKSDRRGWRRILDIDDAEALFAVRGFRAGDPAVARRLETVGATFINGYRTGLYSDSNGVAHVGLRFLSPEMRGFFAEGVAMGCAVADVSSLGGRRLRRWLAATQGDFTYLAHVGAGWAMARLPLACRSISRQLDPVHKWLALDGMGFHDAYFFPDRVLTGWRRVKRGYAAHAYDQGVGRALWFIACGDIGWAAEQVVALSSARHGYLWAGLGLALAYAGPVRPGAARSALAHAGSHGADFLQGVAFGAAARVRGGFVPDDTRAAVAELIGGASPEDVTQLVDGVRSSLPPANGLEAPRYELWRRGVRRLLPQLSDKA